MNHSRLRRIASHQVLMPDGQLLRQAVVEMKDGVVVRCFPLVEELPQTEWLSGEVTIRKDTEGFLRAYYENKMIE